MSLVDLSIVVAVRNQLPHNELFLEVLEASRTVRTELIVVDNSSTDGSAELFRRAGARVVATGGNLCYPEAMNLGLVQATGEYIGFLNNDIVVSRGWDGELAAAIERHRLPAVSPVGIERMPAPEITRVVQERWRWVKRRTAPIRTADDLLGAVRVMYGDWEGFCQGVRHAFGDRLVAGIVGSCVVARREFMRAIGGWDERVQAADWDLYLRLCERAETVGDVGPPMVAGWVYVHHYVQATRRGERSPFTCAHGRLGVQEKWGEAAIRRWFFDPSLLVERPSLRRAPLAYLRARTRRFAKDGGRAIAAVRMLFDGLPGAEELLARMRQGTASGARREGPAA
jgi:GT2 family glycosyltransferase